jgi:hypothetical protein
MLFWDAARLGGRHIMRRTLLIAILVLLFDAARLVVPAHAVPITYRVTATGTGSLGASNFTNALVTVTMTSDTSTVTPGSAPFIFSNTGPATVDVAGIGTATFTRATAVFVDQTASPPLAGFEDVGFCCTTILATRSSHFASYDLKSAFGPLTDLAIVTTGVAHPTTLGNFTLTSVGETSTFTAVLGATQPVPTLSEWVMTGLGVFLVAVAVRRLRRRPGALG